MSGPSTDYELPLSDPDLGRRRRRQRQRPRTRLSTAQKASVGAVAAVGALIAAFASPAPTGNAVVDVLYRMGFAVGLTFAAAPARRWALVVASAVVSAGALGVPLALGLAALVLSVVLIARDLRDRVWAAMIGGLVANAAMGLAVGGFLGSSLLVALTAAACLVVSGVRNSAVGTRARLGRGLKWTAVSLALAGLCAFMVGLSTQSDVSRGVELTNDAVALVEDGRTAEASETFRRAADALAGAADTTGAWWSLPAKLIPGVAQNISVVGTVADSGSRLAAAARRSSAEVDYELLRRPGGGVDLNRLAQFAEPVRSAAAELARARTEVAELNSPWLVGPLVERLRLFERRVVELDDDARLAALALERAPALLGGEGPRRYLVLLGNPAEARDLGGHIGNWAELEADQGVLRLVRVGRPAELSNPGAEATLRPEDGFPESLLALLPATYPQNWGGSIDFGADARLASRLFQEVTGEGVDGVFYADPFVLEAVLRIAGDVAVPELDRRLRADDVVQFLTYDQYVEFTDRERGDEAVTELVRVLFDRFVTTRLPGPERLGQLFGPLVRSGRLRMATVHEADRPLLRRVGLEVPLPFTDDDTDLVAVVHRNANPSKIDSFLRRDTTVDVRWDPEDGEVLTTVRVRLANDAPAEGLPDEVIGNGNGEPAGTNTLDLAVLTPSEELRLVTVDDRDATSVGSVADGEVFRHEVRVSVPPGGSRTVEFVVADDREPGDAYSLFFAGQPLVTEGSVELTVRSAGRRPVSGRGIVVVGDTATTRQSGSENTRLSVRVR